MSNIKKRRPSFNVDEKPSTFVSADDIREAAQNNFDRVNNAISFKEEIEEETIWEKSQKSKIEVIQSNKSTNIINDVKIPVLQVPSLFKCYPSNVKISYYRYSHGDIDNINNGDLNLESQYRLMLDGIVTENMKKENLTFSDMLYINSLRLLEALGAKEYVYKYKCYSCNKEGQYKFSIDQIEFKPLEPDMPLKVRFHTYPDEEFHFIPQSIGDILNLLDSNNLFRTIDGRYLMNTKGHPILDTMAVLASCVTNKPWKEAYIKLLNVNQDARDVQTIENVDRLLNHSILPINFNCNIPLDEEVDISHLDGIEAPEEIKNQFKNFNTKTCGAAHSFEVDGGEVFVPFLPEGETSGFGIIS